MAAYHVLVVDDNHEIRRMVTASIKTLGEEIDVLDVPSAEEALVISASLPLDLIVLDFRLPGMSGLEMVARLRKRKPGIKIILVTGVEDATSRAQVAEAEVNAYFFKPIEISAFLDAVKQALGFNQSTLPFTGTVPITRSPTSASGEPSVNKKQLARKEPASKVQVPASTSRFQPTLDERLNALKQQLKATTILLISDAGQVVEMAGNPSSITTGSALLPAFIDSVRACQNVTDIIGRDATETLVQFINGRLHIYLSPVEPDNVLLVNLSGYIEPDKVGLIERAIHLAVTDLQSILEQKREAESSQKASSETELTELPADVIVDQETLAVIDELFSQAPGEGRQEKADGFWETLEENGELDGRGGKDVISYDEARKMGFTLDEDE